MASFIEALPSVMHNDVEGPNSFPVIDNHIIRRRTIRSNGFRTSV